MDPSVLDSAPLQHYATLARRYCTLIESHRSHRLREFLLETESLLPSLYQAATQLPEVEPATSETPPESTSAEGFGQLLSSLSTFLGDHDPYREIFDPSDPQDREPVQGSLADDLTEIHHDVSAGLALLSSAPGIAPADIAWQWRFDFTFHWGRHAASALRVINTLLHSHYVVNEDPRGADA